MNVAARAASVSISGTMAVLPFCIPEIQIAAKNIIAHRFNHCHIYNTTLIFLFQTSAVTSRHSGFIQSIR